MHGFFQFRTRKQLALFYIVITAPVSLLSPVSMPIERRNNSRKRLFVLKIWANIESAHSSG